MSCFSNYNRTGREAAGAVVQGPSKSRANLAGQPAQLLRNWPIPGPRQDFRVETLEAIAGQASLAECRIYQSFGGFT